LLGWRRRLIWFAGLVGLAALQLLDVGDQPQLCVLHEVDLRLQHRQIQFELRLGDGQLFRRFDIRELLFLQATLEQLKLRLHDLKLRLQSGVLRLRR
jgi:hypothetical protein